MRVDHQLLLGETQLLLGLWCPQGLRNSKDSSRPKPSQA